MFGIALGYEDLNDHDELRRDPMMAVLAGKLAARREDCAPVAGKSTLNRLELSRLQPTRYHRISHNPMAIKRLLVDLFVDAYERPPQQIVLDLDATDDPVHGEQEGRFFHGYYDCYCYLPLYVFCGRHLLAAKLRPANMDAAAGAAQEVARIVAQIRRGKPARYFKDFRWATRRTWSRERRVVGKAEFTGGEANPRFEPPGVDTRLQTVTEAVARRSVTTARLCERLSRNENAVYDFSHLPPGVVERR